MTKRTPYQAPLNDAVEAFATALRGFDPHAVERARTMNDRLRDTFAALRAALQTYEPHATPRQRAQLEARLVPLTKQARGKFATLAALNPSTR